MVMATDAATQITVRTRMPGRFGFLNTWLKLLSPADPIVMPSGVMFWNDVWTIVTIGHSTTTAIRAIAGPIHSSGSRAASLCRLDGRAGAAARRPGGRARLRCSGRRSRLGRGDVRHQGLLRAAWDGRAAARDDTRAAASCSGRAQLPLLAVCWIAPRTCAGLPVMAWPTWVLIMFSTDVQFASDG